MLARRLQGRVRAEARCSRGWTRARVSWSASQSGRCSGAISAGSSTWMIAAKRTATLPPTSNRCGAGKPVKRARHLVEGTQAPQHREGALYLDATPSPPPKKKKKIQPTWVVVGLLSAGQDGDHSVWTLWFPRGFRSEASSRSSIHWFGSSTNTYCAISPSSTSDPSGK